MDKTFKPPTDTKALAEHKKKDVKTRKIVLDGVKDHVVSHLSRKKTAGEMWEVPTKLYQSDKHKRKMVLREKLEHCYVQD